MPEVSLEKRSGHPLLVVSNREPYAHARRADGTIEVKATTGGVAVALDALMRERGGTWIAAGSGDADAAVVDEQDRVAVPPDAPTYQLRRIWLSKEDERDYYDGFANEGLWPLAHIVHVQPQFRSDDWDAYRRVNARFAEAVAAELSDAGTTSVFIQDYHLALVASELRQIEPRARTAFFWHIPWPSADRLRMCPWRTEIIQGLLANDLLAFQLDRDRQNFLDSVRDEIGAEADQGSVVIDGHTTRVIAVPIGVDFDRIDRIARDPGLDKEVARLFREERLDEAGIEVIGVGVDRLDYTKGILERLDAIDHLLVAHPELCSKLAFVQVGVPSRSRVHSYAELEARVDARVAEVNLRHGQGGRGPIRYRKSALKLRPLVALYRLADFCVVSSLHDGMNLVAKEFVAAREDLGGVLVLSEMAGAAQELTDAVLMNPYHTEGFADALALAIAMPVEERASRMRALRRVVAGRDVFRWASDILERLEEMPVVRPWPNSSGRFRMSGPRTESAANVRG